MYHGKDPLQIRNTLHFKGLYYEIFHKYGFHPWWLVSVVYISYLYRRVHIEVYGFDEAEGMR